MYIYIGWFHCSSLNKHRCWKVSKRYIKVDEEPRNQRSLQHCKRKTVGGTVPPMHSMHGSKYYSLFTFTLHHFDLE